MKKSVPARLTPSPGSPSVVVVEPASDQMTGLVPNSQPVGNLRSRDSSVRSTIARILRRVKSWDALALLFLGIWHFVYFWPVTIGQQVFIDGDILYSYLPFHAELARALAAGRLPLWTPGIQAGFPLLAEGEVGALYPPNLIFHLLLSAPVALSYIILFDWSWASIGMYLLCRSLKLRVASGLLAALVFGASGFMIARAPHVPVVAVASWLPWLLLFQHKYWRARYERQPGSPWLLLTAVSIGLFCVAGYPPMAFLNIAMFMLLGLLAPFLWDEDRGALPRKAWLVASVRRMPRAALMTLLSVALGLGLAAMQLLPTAELTSLSTRGQELGRAFFTSFSLEPSYLTQLVVPFGVLGPPNFYNMEYWGYLGLLPLLLALVAVAWRRDVRTWFFFLLALAALSLALGKNNPMYDWLYNVPIFNRFRVPARFLFLFTFAGAYLAGVGLQELGNRLRGSAEIGWKALVLGILFGAAILLVVYEAYTQPATFWQAGWTGLPWLWAFLSVGIVALSLRRVMTQTALAIVVVGVTVLDLSAFSAPFLAGPAELASPAEVAAVPRTVRIMDRTPSAYRFLSDKWPSGTEASIRTALLTNLSLLYGEQSATAYEPSLALERNEEYALGMSSAMQNLMNIRYYLVPLEPLPWNSPPSLETEPEMGLSLDLLRRQPNIPPTPAVQVEMVSYTDKSTELPDGSLAGQLLLTLDSGKQMALPIRLGSETADWAYDGLARIGKISHSKPADAISFPAYLSAVGSEFQGNKYIARFDIAASASPVIVTAVGVRSLLPDAGLTVESVSLVDEEGHSVSLASLLQRNDLALVFRSHAAAMWENRDVLPRAFMVHSAEIVKDAQALARIREPGFRPDQIVLLDDGQPLEGSGAIVPGQTPDQVAITEYQPERVTLSVRTDRVGYLVLADSWYPGWEVRVDGQGTPMYRGDYIFRAVPIQPGQHSVVFEYHPGSFVWGAWISGLSAVVVVLLALTGFKF